MGIKYLFLSALLIGLVTAGGSKKPKEPTYNSGACIRKRLYNRAMHLFWPKQQDGSTPLTSALCRTIFKTDQDYFSVTHDGGTLCPKPTHDVDKTLYSGNRANVMSEANWNQAFCSGYNWQKGSKKEDGSECNPEATKNKLFTDNSAPLILGFGGPINKECGYDGTPEVVENPKWTEGSCTETKWIVKNKDTVENTIKKCCMDTGKIYHRLWLAKDPPASPGWSLCENYRWVMCGAAGYMHNQKKTAKGGKIKLVTIPSEMLIEVGGDKKPIHDISSGKYSVTIHEFCTLDRVCKNTDQLWKATKGSEFECEFDAGWKTATWFTRPANRAESQTSYASEIAVQAANLADFLSTNKGIGLQGIVLALVLMQLGIYCCRSSKAIENEYSELLNGMAENTV